MFQRDRTTSAYFINYSTLNTEHNEETCHEIFTQGINERALPITITKLGKVRFSIEMC